jgi:ATP-dependent DNA helicase MPH1
MRGKEENDYKQAKDNYEKMQLKIEKGTEFSFHDDTSPRIVPKEILPIVDKRVVEIPIENSQGGIPIPSRRKTKNMKKPPKKFHMPDGVETGFAFVGGGQESQRTAKGNKPPPKPKLDGTIAPLPPLHEATLTEEQTFELEQLYVQVAGTEDQYTQLPRFDVFPKEQSKLGKTSLVGHSHATRRLVNAYRRMRNPVEDSERPRDCEGFEELWEDWAPSEKVKPPLKKSKRRDRPTHVKSPNTLSSESVRSPEKVNGLDRRLFSSFSVCDPPQVTEESLGLVFSQQSIGFDENDDMPDLDAFILKRGKSTRSDTEVGMKRSAVRRVVDSDDDE